MALKACTPAVQVGRASVLCLPPSQMPAGLHACHEVVKVFNLRLLVTHAPAGTCLALRLSKQTCTLQGRKHCLPSSVIYARDEQEDVHACMCGTALTGSTVTQLDLTGYIGGADIG